MFSYLSPSLTHSNQMMSQGRHRGMTSLQGLTKPIKNTQRCIVVFHLLISQVNENVNMRDFFLISPFTWDS